MFLIGSSFDFRSLLKIIYFHQTLYNLRTTSVLEEPSKFVILNWLLLVYQNLIFQFLICILLFEICFSICDDKIYARNQMLIRCSKLPESLSKFLLYGVILRFANNSTFWYVSKYMERFLNKLSKDTDLLWSGGLHASTISPFPGRRFSSRKRISLSSLCEFNCFTGMLSLT